MPGGTDAGKILGARVRIVGNNKSTGTQAPYSSKESMDGSRFFAPSRRMAATIIGRSDTALGAFYHRLSSRAGKAKAVTATARKIAILFYNTLRLA